MLRDSLIRSYLTPFPSLSGKMNKHETADKYCCSFAEYNVSRIMRRIVNRDCIGLNL